VDSPRAKTQAGPLAVVFLHGLVEATLGLSLPPPIQTLVDDYRKLHQTYQPTTPATCRCTRTTCSAFARRRSDSSHRSSSARRPSPLAPKSSAIVSALSRRAATSSSRSQLVRGHESAIEDWAKLIEGV